MTHLNNNNNLNMINSNNRLFSEFYTSFENEKLTDTTIIGTESSSLIDIHFGILKLQSIPASITNNDIFGGIGVPDYFYIFFWYPHRKCNLFGAIHVVWNALQNLNIFIFVFT